MAGDTLVFEGRPDQVKALNCLYGAVLFLFTGFLAFWFGILMGGNLFGLVTGGIGLACIAAGALYVLMAFRQYRMRKLVLDPEGIRLYAGGSTLWAFRYGDIAAIGTPAAGPGLLWSFRTGRESKLSGGFWLISGQRTYQVSVLNVMNEADKLKAAFNELAARVGPATSVEDYAEWLVAPAGGAGAARRTPFAGMDDEWYPNTRPSWSMLAGIGTACFIWLSTYRIVMHTHHWALLDNVLLLGGILGGISSIVGGVFFQSKTPKAIRFNERGLTLRFGSGTVVEHPWNEVVYCTSLGTYYILQMKFNDRIWQFRGHFDPKVCLAAERRFRLSRPAPTMYAQPVGVVRY